jgi:hypothetical protein
MRKFFFKGKIEIIKKSSKKFISPLYSSIVLSQEHLTKKIMANGYA